MGVNTLASATYTLDNQGNRSQRVDTAGTQTYGYPSASLRTGFRLYRLNAASYPGPVNDSYTYDSFGNRLTKNTTNYSYDAADHVIAIGGVSYGFDPSTRLRAGFTATRPAAAPTASSGTRRTG